MKRIITVLVLSTAVSAICAQEFKKPVEGKSLVYFIRSSGTGALINFKYFDGDKYLGKLNGTHYFEYECEPGEHIFWAAAENRDFLKANLKPNSTYVVEVRPTMGAMKAAVRLHPISPDNEKFLKKAAKIMGKKSAATLKMDDDDMAYFIETGLERYEKLESEGDVKVLDSEATFNK